jgi:hypothetical protein
MDVIAIARSWREQYGYVGRGGVVVVHEGAAQGWVNALRNADHWKPGCVAVDESGQSWTALAGDDQHGALMWMPNHTITE